MADESFAEREVVINSYSNIPQSFFMEDMVITQPTGRETVGSNRVVGADTLCSGIPIGRRLHIQKTV